MVAGTEARERATEEVPEAGPGVSGADLLVGALPRKRRWPGLVALYLLTVFVLITINFLLPRLMPGDPIDAMTAEASAIVQEPEVRERLAEYYGIDKPLITQYFQYLGQLARGDLGESIRTRSPVSEDLRGTVGWSFLLIITASVIAIAIGIPAGVHSGWKRGQRVDRGLLTFFVTAQNIPVFFLAFMALILLSYQFGIFPLGGAHEARRYIDPLRHVLDILHHLALPALMLAFEFVVYEYLIMRSSMVGELGSNYLLAGRAKGLREHRLKYRYAARNALLPVVTVVGLQFSVAITTIVFIERIFSYPGVGSYMFAAIGRRDYPAIQGAFLVLTLTVVTTNLLIDLLYRRLDPRTKT
ncbi:MAG: ABC transporter permease [Actinomycetota bacterium]|nr:ABC transporter permease [Actinomycetota bacterium]